MIIPWGTSDKTGDQEEQVPRRTTRFLKKFETTGEHCRRYRDVQAWKEDTHAVRCQTAWKNPKRWLQLAFCCCMISPNRRNKEKAPKALIGHLYKRTGAGKGYLCFAKNLSLETQRFSPRPCTLLMLMRSGDNYSLSVLMPFLNKGVTLASFQRCCSLPVENGLSKKKQRWGQNTCTFPQKARLS